MDTRLKHDSSMMVVGPSLAGKSVFITKLIMNYRVMFDIPPARFLWCYGIKQAKPNIKGVEFHEGLPSIDSLKPHDFVILDDLMHESAGSADVTAMFTKCVHHLRIFLVMIVQNLFAQHKEARTRHLNSHYIVLFKSPRDASAIQHLARQMYPGSSKFLTQAFRDATQKPHSYLFLDYRQETDEQLRVRSGILPGEDNYVYINMEEELSSRDEQAAV